MRVSRTIGFLLVGCLLANGLGCPTPQTPSATPVSSPSNPNAWLGIPSAVNQVITMIHDGTGWLLNKSEVSVKKVGNIRPTNGNVTSESFLADYQIAVSYGGESFETTATDVPCDRDGIPTEASVERLRVAVEDIKQKMKRLQN